MLCCQSAIPMRCRDFIARIRKRFSFTTRAVNNSGCQVCLFRPSTACPTDSPLRGSSGPTYSGQQTNTNKKKRHSLPKTKNQQTNPATGIEKVLCLSKRVKVDREGSNIEPPPITCAFPLAILPILAFRQRRSVLWTLTTGGEDPLKGNVPLQQGVERLGPSVAFPRLNQMRVRLPKEV